MAEAFHASRWDDYVKQGVFFIKEGFNFTQ